jgi:hypothetical protein
MSFRPHVARITEPAPWRRRIHVVGEVHPGELAERGYARIGEEWVLELARPLADPRADPLGDEFRALSALGYGFAEGDEWSPAEILRTYVRAGRLRGEIG